MYTLMHGPFYCTRRPFTLRAHERFKATTRNCHFWLFWRPLSASTPEQLFSSGCETPQFILKTIKNNFNLMNYPTQTSWNVLVGLLAYVGHNEASNSNSNWDSFTTYYKFLSVPLKQRIWKMNCRHDHLLFWTYLYISPYVPPKVIIIIIIIIFVVLL